MPINKPWQQYSHDAVKLVPATLGVFELADEAGQTIYIGMAGGREPFGLRGAITARFSNDESNETIRSRATAFRIEVTARYYSRLIELLTLHREKYGELPNACRTADYPIRLGRFHQQPTTGK
jgi:hypothetical protein